MLASPFYVATMSHHSLLRSFLLPTLLPLVLPMADATAQVQAGDIATTRFSTTEFDIQRGTTRTAYNTGGFGGTGSSFAVLWDPTNPNDFLVGGFDFIGRATITGPGTVSYSLISAAVGIVVGMSWDNDHQVVFIDAAAGQVRRLDPANGQIVDLSTGTQPWGFDANAGAFDPATGDTVVGGNGALYRLRRGTTTAVAARRMKNPKTTFSRFMGTGRIKLRDGRTAAGMPYGNAKACAGGPPSAALDRSIGQPCPRLV